MIICNKLSTTFKSCILLWKKIRRRQSVREKLKVCNNVLLYVSSRCATKTVALDCYSASCHSVKVIRVTNWKVAESRSTAALGSTNGPHSLSETPRSTPEWRTYVHIGLEAGTRCVLKSVKSIENPIVEVELQINRLILYSGPSEHLQSILGRLTRPMFCVFLFGNYYGMSIPKTLMYICRI